MTAFHYNTVLSSIMKSAAIPTLNPFPLLNAFPLTITERIVNVLMHITDKIIYHFFLCPKLTNLVRTANKFNSTSSVSELSNRSILYLINYDPAVDGPQQLLPNVIGVGGLLIKEPETLPNVSILNYMHYLSCFVSSKLPALVSGSNLMFQYT